jgi:hypothetical protein
MKLRLLNGSHSTLAYLGYLAGYDFLWQASADPELAKLVERLMTDEVIPTLEAPPNVDLAAYGAQVRERFRNPALPHRTKQVAMDGSQKLPQRFLATVRERLAAGKSIAHLALAIAGWIRYASGTDESGRPIAVSDPLAPKFAAIASASGGNASQIADGFLDLVEVFGTDLTHDVAFRRAVSRDVGSLFRDGVRRTLACTSRNIVRRTSTMAVPLELHPDRLFPVETVTAGLARALYATVEHLPIVSPHGHTDPAVVRRRSAIPRRVGAVYHPRSLRFPDAVQPRHPARGPRHSAARRRPRREGRAQDLAHLRRQLSPFPRHADAHLARPRVLDRVRHHGAALR